MNEADVTPLALPRERLTQNWEAAERRASAYLRAAGLAEADAARLAAEATVEAATRARWESGATAFSETIAAAQRLWLAGEAPDLAGEPGSNLWAARLLSFAPKGTGGERPPRLPWTPPLARGRMLPHAFGRGSRGRRRPPRPVRARRAWRSRARARRVVLLVAVLLPATVASGFMLQVLPRQGGNGLEWVIAVLFGTLFGWVSIGMWTALFGFLTLLRRGDRFSITRPVEGEATGSPLPRTALVMPIREEPVARVFAGMRAVYRSLERAGALESFDLFVLSDSVEPATCLAEEEAWAHACRDLDAFGRLFYRRRRVKLKRKTGNISDFLRRWGQRYRYMVVFDADSVMVGETLVRLVRLMESHPDAAIIQTAPAAVNRRSLFGRIQQFSNRLYGPVFSAGLHFWQLGDGLYWGHNAILRVAPFMEHCGLAPLPGKPPLGGEILSHDFVEAALLGRAGFTLWLAYDLEGTYEEMPSSLLEEIGRDRRWCQGNLQHLRLLFKESFYGAHRALFLNGALSYVSALLWFSFLLASSAEAILSAIRPPDYFPSGRSLFPEWPVWRPHFALALLAVTIAILFLPKLLSIAWVVLSRQTRQFGGIGRLSLSALCEMMLSSLLAPIRMVFHARFVIANLLGRTVTWRSAPRDDRETTLRLALRRHAGDTLVASTWAVALYVLRPEYFFWALPIAGALLLAIPLSVWTSRVRTGQRARRLGLFLTPEEIDPPIELRELREASEGAPSTGSGLQRAVVDPLAHALHLSFLRHPRQPSARARAARDRRIERALRAGPDQLSTSERRALVDDRETLERLHTAVWSLADPEPARAWGVPA
jgi:membrane glycosyltransferase